MNADKYSKEKKASFISLKTGFDSVKNRYFLRITDNGIGVLNSDLPFIFDKGFTGDHPYRKQSTGIGVYLVRKLCDELQIEIEVESKYGKEFVIQFLFTKIEERCFYH
ncbi:ATP-binding protein [Psychrobacillus sp. NEAU-3TGS]|uniref:ATP-binding protein n=1 Tax=Psychrobacillus sp. NEAU-3TGS TaxID=2995412 RepID=UPI002496D5D7|nr:ATP-binding protein [Psychrobacillus sp. NEAU-3TGS]MDI2589162.1 ATP-binding protein [Psychrobacillus sp. NEAU-3TGS]